MSHGIKVPGKGPSNARIMVVGEAPGGEEVVAREPFVGYAGKVLKGTMQAAGINPAEVYFTNICKYRPPGNELTVWFDPRTGTPTEPIIEGLAELKEEIATVKPNVIVALGNDPLWALTGKAKWNHKKNSDTGIPHGYTGIGNWRGSIIEGNALTEGRKVVAAYHPAAVTRKWPWRVYLDLDLRRAGDQSGYADIRRPQRVLHIDPDWETRVQLRDRWLADLSRPLSFDIEFIGSDLLCVGFCNSSGEAACIPTKGASDLRFIREILESGVPLRAQNGMFDCSVLEHHYKLRTFDRLVYDTMLANHAAYIELPKDLGTLCSVYTEQPCYWTEISWPDIKKGKQPISDVYEYNAIDAWVTHEVAEAQLSDELKDPATRRTFEFEMALIKPLWEISKRGIKIDMAKKAKLAEEIDASIAENQLLLDALAGRCINVMSGPQLSQFLIKELGLPSVRKTKTGKDGTGDKDLAAMALSPKALNDKMCKTVLKTIRSIKQDRALKSKFLEMKFSSDGRFRHQYSPAGTNTGRLSSSKFAPTSEGSNGQNIHRDKRVRKLYIPDEGRTFFYNDLERAESLVVAHLTGDPLMLAHHAPGVNAHKELGSLLFEVPVAEIDKDGEVYYMGKQTRHAGNYMQGARTFMNNVNKKAEETGVSIDYPLAKKLIDRYRDLHVGLGTWWRAVEREVRATQRLSNLLGRVRIFFDRIDNTLPEAVAFVPQSTVGDTLNTALLRIAADEELRDYGVQMLLQVHDAIGGQVKTEWLDPAMRRMEQLMRVELVNPRTLEPFIIPVEIAVGPSWGECKGWHDPLKEAA